MTLSERVEAASGPDRELDAEIARLAWEHRWPVYDGGTINYDPDLWLERYGWSPTGSLDAARSLVPEGWQFFLDSNVPAATVYIPCLAHNKSTKAHGGAATPALALTAAALRARGL